MRKFQGKISLMTQSPWFFSGTIKDNIVFYEKFDSHRYQQILKMCCIEGDLSQFALGDKTLIEANGSNLSGGQRKRISLARCLYREADIYLLDDPLSEIDLLTKYTIFQNMTSQGSNIVNGKVIAFEFRKLLLFNLL